MQKATFTALSLPLKHLLHLQLRINFTISSLSLMGAIYFRFELNKNWTVGRKGTTIDLNYLVLFSTL